MALVEEALFQVLIYSQFIPRLEKLHQCIDLTSKSVLV